MIAKAEQLSLSLAGRRRDPLAPGSRGGRFYVDGAGHIRYGAIPAGSREVKFNEHLRSKVQSPQETPSGLLSRRIIDTPGAAADIFRGLLDLDRERIWGIYLDAHSKVFAIECISQGSISQTIAHPRECLKNAVAMGAKRLVLVHNHPAGDPVPSPEDMLVTRRIDAAAREVGIALQFHVVVGADGWEVLDPDGHATGRAAWGTAASGDTTPIPGVEGRIKGAVPRHHIDLFDTVVNTSELAAAAGRKLLNPTDQTAVALLLDNKNRVIGVFPIAGETMQGARPRLFKAILATSASAVVLVAAKDGAAWQEDFAKFQNHLSGAFNTFGVNHLDSVSASPNDYRSNNIHGTVRWTS